MPNHVHLILTPDDLAGLAHARHAQLPYNMRATKSASAAVAGPIQSRADPNEQESAVVRPELDTLCPGDTHSA